MVMMLSIFEAGAWAIVAEAFFLYGSNNATRIHELAGISTSVSGILFGFLLTAIAMLTTMPENRLMQNMKKTGHLKALVGEAVAGCAFHFFTLSLSLAAAISEGILARILLVAALSTLTTAIIRTGSAGRKLKFVASALHSTQS